MPVNPPSVVKTASKYPLFTTFGFLSGSLIFAIKVCKWLSFNTDTLPEASTEMSVPLFTRPATLDVAIGTDVRNPESFVKLLVVVGILLVLPSGTLSKLNGMFPLTCVTLLTLTVKPATPCGPWTPCKVLLVQ